MGVWLPLQLVWNAILGWGDDQLAVLLGMKNPSVSQVYEALIELGPSLALAAMVFYAYHRTMQRWDARQLAGFGNSNDKRQTLEKEDSNATSKETLVSMKEAATKVYSVARPIRHFWAVVAEDNAKKPSFMGMPSRDDKILGTISNLIAGKIPIYGEASPSRERELIENVDKQHSEFFDGGNTLRFLLFDKTEYRNVCVRTLDLEAVIQYVKRGLTENTPI